MIVEVLFCLPRRHAFKLGQIGFLKIATRNATVNKTVAFLDTVDNLKSLSVHGISLTDGDVLRLLDKLTLLEEVSLTFTREGSGPEVLKTLTAPTGAPFVKPALPLLQGVNFYFDRDDKRLMIALLDMLSSRLLYSTHSDASQLSEVASLENILIKFEKGSCSHDAARVIRYSASSAYRLRWVDWKTFSLLKAGRKHRWVGAASKN
ncbi:hypothetical protein CPB85DRAFT_892334 [Mucidula mucida]|nr:hypothetical protein CPB85DRAFT_892334 [Mucidula mucida]